MKGATKFQAANHNLIITRHSSERNGDRTSNRKRKNKNGGREYLCSNKSMDNRVTISDWSAKLKQKRKLLISVYYQCTERLQHFFSMGFVPSSLLTERSIPIHGFTNKNQSLDEQAAFQNPKHRKKCCNLLVTDCIPLSYLHYFQRILCASKPSEVNGLFIDHFIWRVIQIEKERRVDYSRIIFF